MKFKPIKGNQSVIPLEANDGTYNAKIVKVEVASTNDQYPMLKISEKLVAAEDDENKEYVGNKLRGMLTFYPDGHENARFARQNLADFCNGLEIDTDLIPEEINDEKDFDPFIEAIMNREHEVYVKLKTKDGNTNVNVNYRAPRAQGSDGGGSTAADPDPEPRAKAKAAKDADEGKAGKPKKAK